MAERSNLNISRLAEWASFTTVLREQASSNASLLPDRQKAKGTQMLETLNGKCVMAVPHRGDFDALIHRLGTDVADAIRDYLDRIIDSLPLDRKTGRRTFGTSQLGRELSPWKEPLAQLYFQSREFLGMQASEKEVEDRAALWFGLFVWERIIERDEPWVFWDPNLSATDLNREPQGKVYFERST